MTVKLSDTVFKPNDLITSGLNEDLVMLSIQSGKYYGINAVGRRIWELLESPICASTLCEKLGQEFEVSREQCQADVLAFLNDLEAQGLLLKPQDACLSPDAC